MESETMLDNLTRPIIGIENRTPLEVFDIMADRIRHSTRTEPSTITEEGLVERVARAICWKFSEDTDDCSSVCLDAKKCMAETVDTSFVQDANAALAASGHTALLSQIGVLREALEEIRSAVEKRQLPITNQVYELADAALSRPLP